MELYERSRKTSGNLFFKPRKLDTQQRDEIIERYLNGETAASLALEFGVSRSAIRGLVPRRT